MAPQDPFLAAGIYCLSLLLLGYLPIRRRFGPPRWDLVLLMAGVPLLRLGLAVWEFQSDAGTGVRVMAAFLAELVTAALTFRCTRQSFFFQLFIVFMISNYCDNLWFGASAVKTTFFPENASNWAQPMLWEFVLLALTLPILLFSMRGYLTPLLETDLAPSFWRCLCVVPVGAFFLYRVSIDPTFLDLTRQHCPALMAVLWPHLCFLSYFAVFKMCRGAMARDHLARQVRMVDLASEARRRQLEQERRLNARTKEAQAQVLEHLRMLQDALSHGDGAGAEALLERWSGQLDALSAKRVCKNAAVDGVVCQYLHRAEQAGIRTETRLDLPARLPIPELDFFVLLGNLLENALEACGRQTSGERFLRLNSSVTGSGTLLLSVFNSYGGAVVRSGAAFCSSKEKGRLGLGIASVQALTARYGGVTQFQYGNGVFEASVLLPPPPPPREGGGA